MNEEFVKNISKEVFWDKFKMLVALGSVVDAIQEFWDTVNKDNDGHCAECGGDECSRSEG